MQDMYRTLGLVVQPHNDEPVKTPKEQVKGYLPIPHGKEICEKMRQMRIQLAEANGIAYVPQECHHEGECAGTCYTCDEEMSYLNRELNKIPPEQRIYPKYNGDLGT